VQGAVVLDVSPYSAAAEAGVKAGDTVAVVLERDDAKRVVKAPALPEEGAGRQQAS
jgi:S1-C subfamily serine protease